MKNLRFFLFPIYVPATFIKPKLQIHPTNPKCLLLWNLLGSSYKKMLIKNFKFILNSLYTLEIH